MRSKKTMNDEPKCWRFWGTNLRNEVIEKLRVEAVRRGISITQLVNQTLDEAIPRCRITVEGGGAAAAPSQRRAKAGA